MYLLQTKLDSRDAFVVALRNAFKKAGVPLAHPVPGQTPDPNDIVTLEMQVDHVTAGVSLFLPNPPKRHEFLEENPDMLEIALGDSLVRQFRR
jgi:hypothetical protein